MLEMFTEARGVAVVGASTSPEKLGYQVLNNIIQYGYEGGIYPINPTAPEILGHKAYASVLECPDPSVVGRSFADIARERGGDAVDVFLDLVARHGSKLRWYTVMAAWPISWRP